VVLATNGSTTYTLFLYKDIQWGNSGTSVGFNAGDGLRGYNLPFTMSFSLPLYSNVGRPGVFIFRVDEEVIQEPKGMAKVVYMGAV